jgi:hypothetical protein
MLDYCRKNLDDNVTLFVKGIDIMWQITCGMDYLNRHKIHHGNIMLENVLFWKRNSCSKRIVVKQRATDTSYFKIRYISELKTYSLM